MKTTKNIIFSMLLTFILPSACFTAAAQISGQPVYKPESMELYNEIVRMDSTWEDSYNHCKMDVQDQILSEDIEFFHDQGGLLTSKKRLMDAYKNNICGKVTRELLKGNVEVYPIKDYGAVEMGYHRFYSINDTGPNSKYARFVHIWKKETAPGKLPVQSACIDRRTMQA